MSERRVVIVGAGIVGLSSAYYALRKGLRVTVVERKGDRRDTTSFGNAGLVVPSHFVPLAAPGAVAQGIRWMTNRESPFYVRPTLDPALWRWGYHFWRSATNAHVGRVAPLLRDLNRASLERYRDLDSVLDFDFGLRQRGLVMMCRSQAGLEEEADLAERARGLGVAAEVLDAAGVAALQPGVDLDLAGGVYYPGDAQLNPRHAMAALQMWLERQGVRFLFNREVLSLHGAPRIERVRLRAATPDEADDRPKRERQERRGRATSPFSPDDAQSGAGGAPTPQAAPGGAAAGAGGRDAPMAPAPAPEEDVEEDLEVDELVLAAGVWSEGLARDAGVRLPMRAGKGYSVTLRYPPQTLSVPAILSEARVAITPMGVALRVGGTMEVLSAETAERGGINNARVRGLLGAVADYLPVLERERFEGLPVWYGLRPTTPDGLPYIGRSPRHDNLVIATGHAMMGMSLGPITGELVAELLAGDPPSLPLEALRVDRFG